MNPPKRGRGESLMLRVDKRALICLGALVMAGTMEWRAALLPAMS